MAAGWSLLGFGGKDRRGGEGWCVGACSSTGAGAEQGLGCTHRKRNATGSRWKCDTNIIVQSHAAGCYVSKNFHCRAREGKGDLCPLEIFVLEDSDLLVSHNRRNVIRTNVSVRNRDVPMPLYKAVVRLCMGYFVQVMVTRSQDKIV